jgi:prepilin-type N-terminal cleavage/methylation domain-containing protein
MNAVKHRHGRAGFTLVELLVALVLAAMIAGFVLDGIYYARRASAISSDRDRFEDTDAAVLRLRALLAATMPVTAIDERDRIARQLFDGRGDSLTFVTLSEGVAYWGGLLRVRVKWLDSVAKRAPNGAVVMYTAVFRANERLISEDDPIILFQTAANFSLQYFGASDTGKAPQWQVDWISHDRIPLAVLAQVEVVEKSRSRHIFLQVPLRLASST